MTPHAYYNEHDKNAAAWLRELIAADLIAPGEVDERSIADVQPGDLVGFRQCHFFSGIGGWSLALRLAGIPDDFPVWTGSCPCQPFSAAGNQRGTDDDRHLWPEFFRLIRACQPGLIFGEQVASAAVLGSSAKPSKRRPVVSAEPVWLDGVFADLESAQYACGASDIPAAGVGAPHIRQRAWWVAVANGGHAGAEWQQRGGQQRFEPQDGRASRLAYAASARRDGEEPESNSRHEARMFLPGSGGSARRLADMQRTGLEGHTGNGDDRNEPGRLGAEQAGSVAEGCGSGGMGDAKHPERWPVSLNREDEQHGPNAGRAQAHGEPGASGQVCDHWSRFDLIPCRDGKVRRVPQSCILPVANGVSASVDHLRIASNGHPLTTEKIQGRAALLRGAGNAIVPEVAALFIRASLDSLITP